MKNTSNRQEPYVYGSLGGDDVPLVAAKPAMAPTPNPNAEVRRDYELALQIGTREVWTAFLAQYPDGLYAILAKGQMNKIASEEARVAATEKARLAEEEKTRLRAEGAKHGEQAKAAAQAKTAEDARVAAEKAKEVQQEKVAAAEQARTAAEKARAEAERIATEKLVLQKAAADKLVQEKADALRVVVDKLAIEKTRAEANKSEQISTRVASLPPPDQETKPPLTGTELARALQSELRRVGCNTASADGSWNIPSERSLDLFNKHAGMRLDVKVASVDALDAVKAKSNRVCPLICELGFKADGDKCTKITCRSGYELGDNGSCEKIEVKKPTARRDPSNARREPRERAKADAGTTAPQASRSSGQIVCGHGSCRPVGPGCRLGEVTGATNPSLRVTGVVCN